MNISFDLDNTIIPYKDEFETENRNFFAKMFGVEKIRKGTKQLFLELKNNGHSIHIYTTSYRSKFKIRWMFFCYGISVKSIVNQTDNIKQLKKLKVNSSKYPIAFQFDIHIDDATGVGMEAEKFNFKAIIINTKENNWIEKVKNGVEEMS